MRYLSVCSGIEAASVAWHPLGWEPVAFAEVEPFPCSVLAHHYPQTPNWGDMTRWKEWPDAAVDVLVGGTPCQSFSVAGLRRGLNDPRGGLMLQFLGIADRYRPQWIVWENVPGVLSSNGGRDFGTFLGALGELGYGWAYRVLDAQWFGVAQRRRRVFVVGCFGNQRSAAQVLFERESMRRDTPPSREARERIAGTLSSRTTAGGGLGTDFELSGGLQEVVGTLCSDTHPGCYSGQDAYTGRLVPHPVFFDASRRDGVRLHGNTTHTLQAFAGTGGGNTPMVAFPAVLVPETCGPLCLRSTPNGNGMAGVNQQEATSGQLIPVVAFSFDGFQSGNQKATHQFTVEATAPIIQSRPPCVGTAIGTDCYNGAVTGDVAATIGTPGSSVNASGLTVMQALQVRRLTPRECERLQGFPDDYTQVPHRGKPAADGPRYKALGNSMAVPCMAWIGARIQRVEDTGHAS
jgi:DNA (cytosine-5)-methyltransferase 1